MDRNLRSYNDIAEYIVEQLRFAHVAELPDEFWDRMSHLNHRWAVPVILPAKEPSDQMYLEFQFTSEGLTINWIYNHNIIFTQKYPRPNNEK